MFIKFKNTIFTTWLREVKNNIIVQRKNNKKHLFQNCSNLLLLSGYYFFNTVQKSREWYVVFVDRFQDSIKSPSDMCRAVHFKFQRIVFRNI